MRLWSLLWGPAPSPGLVLVAALASGFIFGVAAVGVNERYRIIEVLTFTPGTVPTQTRPVTPPPPGRVWAPVLTTGYCPCAICCGASADGRTALNRSVADHPFGYAVADFGMLPKLFPLEIPGYGYAEVDDTGGAMRQDAKRGVIHLDLRFPEHQQARRWGRRLVWLSVPDDSRAARLAEQAERAQR